MNIGELLPKRIYDRLDTYLGASLEKVTWVVIKGIECFQNGIQVTEPWSWVIRVVLSKIITVYRAGGTFTGFSTCCKDLFRVLTNEGCEEGMYSLNKTVGRCHEDTRFPSFLEGLKNL